MTKSQSLWDLLNSNPSYLLPLLNSFSLLESWWLFPTPCYLSCCPSSPFQTLPGILEESLSLQLSRGITLKDSSRFFNILNTIFLLRAHGHVCLFCCEQIHETCQIFKISCIFQRLWSYLLEKPPVLVK